jgi:type IV fimbrial biogenesis protein FimT
MLTLASRQRGVSLIELVIGLAIFGILLAAAAPSYRAWIENSKIRAAAESIQNGLQIARVEALKRNQSAEFVMTNDEPIQGNEDSLTASSNGVNWVVRTLTSAGNYDFIQGKLGSEGSNGTQLSVSPDGQNTVRFSALGQASFLVGATPQPANTIFIAVKGLSGTCGSGSGQARCLAVGINPGGQTKICDLTVTDTADSRYCSN